ELPAALADPARGLGEGLAAAGAHLDLRGDQLADEVELELGAARRGLELLEAVGQGQRLRVEDGELLLDGDGEVLPALELLTGEPELLLVGQFLSLAHVATLVKGLEQAGGDARPEPALHGDTPRRLTQP